MIFNENHLLADQQMILREISYFFRKLGKIMQNLLSAAVVIGNLRVTIIVIQREKYSTS